MLILENLATACQQLWVNKLRSLLTVTGIVIGVMSTLVVVAAVEGYSRYVSDLLQGMGTNAIWVWPGRPPGYYETQGPTELTVADIEEVDRACPAIRHTAPFVVRDVNVKYRDHEARAELQGTSDDFQYIRNFFVNLGRCFGPVEIENGKQVCVVGREVLANLQTDEGLLDQHILINGKRFEVIGILEEKGGYLGRSLDNVVLVPYPVAMEMYPETARALPFMADAASPGQVAEARAQLVNALRRRHNLSPDQPDDFRITTQDEILQTFNRIRLIAAGVLIAVVSISLLVGGIGITNVMLVSVTERTREIGLRKALGARRRDILAQFLTEAIVLSTLGGALGIVLGYAITFIVRVHPDMTQVAIPGWTVMLGVGFSLTVGVVFGLLPAVKAAMLQPIDALRYE
jgi:putative ABC transport system permease protein